MTIGTFNQEVKHSISGEYYTETVEITTISEPINIRGKSSSGNWAVEYSSVAQHCVGRMYFWRKREALDWIEEVTA